MSTPDTDTMTLKPPCDAPATSIAGHPSNARPGVDWSASHDDGLLANAPALADEWRALAIAERQRRCLTCRDCHDWRCQPEGVEHWCVEFHMRVRPAVSMGCERWRPR